jgi:phage FluMu protein Com
MQLIKEGKVYRKCRCRQCKAIFIYHIHNDTYFTGEYIKCPECKKLNPLSIFHRRYTEYEVKNRGWV